MTTSSPTASRSNPNHNFEFITNSSSGVMLDSVVAHQKEVKKILFLLKEQQVGRSFIFSGPGGIGKKKIAWAIAQALTCEKMNTLACGLCGACLRAKSHQSEHILFIEPEGIQLKIDQAQTILSFLNLQGSGQNRCIIIDEAQQMNATFANALLKTVEEPPQGTYFFFITSNYTSLLSTLRSRSLHFSFNPLTASEMRQAIQKSSLSFESWMLEASRGSLGLLQKMNEDASSELREKSKELLVLILKEKKHFLSLLWRDEFRDRSQSLEILRFWQMLLRNSIFGKSESIDLTECLGKYSYEFALDFWYELTLLEVEIMQQKDPVLLIEKLWSDFIYEAQ